MKSFAGEQITCLEEASTVALSAFSADLFDYQEQFLAIALNIKAKIIGEPWTVAIGSANSVDVHPRDIYRQAIARNAVQIVVAHNHPSGELEPSEGDKLLTRRLQDAGELLGIPLADSIIVVRGRAYSILHSSTAILAAESPTPPRRRLTVADAAKAIRRELKSRYGWTSKQVSVRSERYSMGSTIRITIRSAAVSKSKVEAIASVYRRVDRCEASGEILSGGNRFVDVGYDRETVRPFAMGILAQIEQLNDVSQVAQLDGGAKAWQCSIEPGCYFAEVPGDAVPRKCWSALSAARYVAEELFDRGLLDR